jgi:pterin-4a-carbinolamine dehydratase
MTGKLAFISYRRSDALAVARRLAKSLRSDFGEDAIYFDEAAAPPGTAWPDSIRAAVQRADVLMPVVGPTWLKSQDEVSGWRRIDLPDDWVRLEIVTFLDRVTSNRDLTVLPLVLGGASLQISKYLDPALRRICDHQPLQIQDTGDATDFARVKQRLTQLGFVRSIAPPVTTPIVGRVPVPLARKDEEAFLAAFPAWRIVERDKPGVSDDIVRELYRLYEFPSYESAWQFMQRVSETGVQPHNHHPRWQNNYNRVEVWLCTSNVGHKPTKRDVRLARIFEETWQSFASRGKTDTQDATKSANRSPANQLGQAGRSDVESV